MNNRPWVLEHEDRSNPRKVRTWHYCPQEYGGKTLCGRDAIPGMPIVGEQPGAATGYPVQVCKTCTEESWRYKAIEPGDVVIVAKDEWTDRFSLSDCLGRVVRFVSKDLVMLSINGMDAFVPTCKLLKAREAEQSSDGPAEAELIAENTKLRDLLNEATGTLIWASGAFDTENLMQKWAAKGGPIVEKLMRELAPTWRKIDHCGEAVGNFFCHPEGSVQFEPLTEDHKSPEKSIPGPGLIQTAEMGKCDTDQTEQLSPFREKLAETKSVFSPGKKFELKIGDHVKVSKDDWANSKNLSGKYGHILEIIDDEALVEFIDFKSLVPIDKLKLASLCDKRLA